MINQQLNKSPQGFPLPNSAPQSFTPLPIDSRKRKNKSLVAIILIIFVLIVGGVAFAIYNYFQSPEVIVQKMIANLAEIKSLDYSGDIQTEINTVDTLSINKLQPTKSDSNTKKSNFSVDFYGATDTGDFNNPKGSFSFNVNTNALGQQSFTFALEVRVIDKFLYLKVSNLPNIGLFNLSSVANKWIKMDAASLKDQYEIESAAESTNDSKTNQDLSQQQIEKIKTAIKKRKVFKITDNLQVEKINGKENYHYGFAIDNEESKNLFIDISQIIKGSTLNKKELASIEEIFNKVGLEKGEIWIGKSDLLPYKFSSTITSKKTGQSDSFEKVKVKALFNNFNKPVQVEIPSPVKTFEEILSEMSNPKSTQQTTQPAYLAEINSIVAKVGKLIPLPTDETPSLATVKDASKLKDPFYKNAMTGDIVLIYVRARKHILYRESSNKVIEVATIGLQ